MGVDQRGVDGLGLGGETLVIEPLAGEHFVRLECDS